MGKLFSGPKIPKPAEPLPPPVDPPRVQAPDDEAVQRAAERAELEKLRRGRSRLQIPLGGTTGGSGISIPVR